MQRILILLLAAGAAYYVFNPSSSATTPSAASGRVYIEPGAYRNVQVELYATDWCPYCKQARAFMDKEGISYIEYNVEQDAAALQRQKALLGEKYNPSKANVPFFVANGHTKKGYSEARFIKFLQIAAAAPK